MIFRGVVAALLALSDLLGSWRAEVGGPSRLHPILSPRVACDERKA